MTACLNRVDWIERAVTSVFAQDYPKVEHIIVDGGSTDGTLEKLKQWPHLRVVSEPDKGIFDAMNKGFRMVTGDIVGLLNTDDTYPLGAFRAAARCFVDSPGLDLVTGRATVVSFEKDISVFRKEYLPPEDPAPYLTLSNMRWKTTTQWYVPIINARFFSLDAIRRIGEFNLAYPIEADFDYLLRAAIERLRCDYVAEILQVYGAHPGSGTIRLDGSSSTPSSEERLQILEDLLEDDRLTSAERRQLRHWHSRQTCLTMASALYSGEGIGSALRYAPRGIRHDAAFPAELVAYSARRLGKVGALRATRTK